MKKRNWIHAVNIVVTATLCAFILKHVKESVGFVFDNCVEMLMNQKFDVIPKISKWMIRSFIAGIVLHMILCGIEAFEDTRRGKVYFFCSSLVMVILTVIAVKLIM